MMKKITLAIALAIATMGAAQAQNSRAPVEPQRLHFVVGMGLTGGGDKLGTLYYEDGDEADVSAGGLIAFTAGVDFRVTPQFSLQSTISYHFDRANSRNGNLQFKRYPIELLAYYHPTPQWRVGGGVRYVGSPKLTSGGEVSGVHVEFDNTIGSVVEAEYLMGEQVGVKLRYVNEKYEVKRYNDKIDGSHVGVYGSYYF